LPLNFHLMNSTVSLTPIPFWRSPW